MDVRIRSAARMAALAVLVTAGFAQEADSQKFFKLDFVVKELESGKVVNIRSHSMIASTNSTSTLRSGARVSLAPEGANFIETGVNVDCRKLKEFGNDLSLVVVAEVTSSQSDPATPAYPVIRQNKWSSDVIVPVRKPTLIFSTDDATGRRQLQVELTATPVK